jgi:hypothetical protein
VPSDVNSAEVIIKRSWNPLASGQIWGVLLDGQEIGTLRVGSSLTVQTVPGEHTVVIRASFGTKWSSLPFSFAAIAGERIDLTTTASWGGRPKLRRSDLQSTQSDSGKAAASSAQITTTIAEGSRYEIPLGDEERVIDNSMSASTTVRVVRLTREWTKTYLVDVEHITTVHGSAAAGFSVLDLKAEAEHTLSKTYSTTTEERETFAEEVTLNISAHTKSKILFSWKEIRQKGAVRVMGAGFELRIPYEVVAGVTFDQQQIDVT